MDAPMTVTHPRWDEFADRLFEALGEDLPGTCMGDDTLSRRLLSLMGADLPSSLAYFAQHGGHCDCTVLFNVDVLAPNNEEDAEL